MAFSRIESAQLTGLGASGVTVEVDISRGLYLFQIVGLPDKAVEESKERVRSAIKNSGADFPINRITVKSARKLAWDKKQSFVKGEQLACPLECGTDFFLP